MVQGQGRQLTVQRTRETVDGAGGSSRCSAWDKSDNSRCRGQG